MELLQLHRTIDDDDETVFVVLRSVCLPGVYAGGLTPPPLEVKKCVLLFNVKKIMQNFEHF